MLFEDFKCNRGTVAKYEEQTKGFSERTIYQHDKGEITYTRTFRRLAYKSHLVTKRDVYCRSKLLHTLEVATIAFEMANLLDLDATLTEAICLGHDVGCYPFSHVGEMTIKTILGDLWTDELYHNYVGYYLLPLESKLMKSADPERYKKLLETGCYKSKTNSYGEDYLITISEETLDGILKHRPKDFRYDDPPNTIEGQLVRIADNFAYITQELTDALELDIQFDMYTKYDKLYCKNRSPQTSNSKSKQRFKYSWRELNDQSSEFNIKASDILSYSTGKRLNAMIHWFIGYNKLKANNDSLQMYRSNILEKNLPLLEYPEELSFIIDFIWESIIGNELHNHKLVKHNFRLASQVINIIFDNIINLAGKTSIEGYDLILSNITGGSKPNDRQKKVVAAKFISEMTDNGLENFLKKLWDLF